MTEDEAKTKWCPFVRQEWGEVNSINRSENKPIGMCISSDCMAWRDKYEHFNVTRNEFQKLGTRYLRSDKMEMRKTGEGYCGLAGEP